MPVPLAEARAVRVQGADRKRVAAWMRSAGQTLVDLAALLVVMAFTVLLFIPHADRWRRPRP